jgi:hypothetical protein
MDDFASVLGKGFAGARKGAPLLAAGLIAGITYAIGLFNNVDVTTADTTTVLVSALVTFIPLVVIPYVTGGALGYALEASAGGKPGWPTFFAAARKHYFSLFFAGIVILIISTLLGYPVALLLISGVGDVSLICLAGLFTVIAMFLVLMLLEFYDVAIVSESLGATDGLRASLAFARKNLGRVVLFFLIVLFAKLFVQLPLFVTETIHIMAQLVASGGDNYSLFFNNTTNGTLNTTYLNTTMAAVTTPMGTTTLISVAVLQVLVQTIVFAFVISYKVEFWRWAKSFKAAKKITDFDYDFSDEKKE